MSRYQATLDSGSNAVVTDNREMEAENVSQQVYLWDIGPEKPVQPKRPVAPKGKEGEPEFELAMVEFREQIEDYARAMTAHRAAVAAFEKFEQGYGGPYEIQRWSVDASDALARDAQAVKEKRQGRLRYYISSRTRGYSGLPNRGLPEGMNPGPAQAESLRRQRAADDEFTQIRKSDPVFGSEVAA